MEGLLPLLYRTMLSHQRQDAYSSVPCESGRLGSPVTPRALVADVLDELPTHHRPNTHLQTAMVELRSKDVEVVAPATCSHPQPLHFAPHVKAN